MKGNSGDRVDRANSGSHHPKSSSSENEEIYEFTLPAVLLGILLAVVLGGANAYLGLKVGMTVSASIPAAVVSMGLLRYGSKILKKFIRVRDNTILENNIVQTIASAAESVAAGIIFTVPALFMLHKNALINYKPSKLEITVMALLGGLLGVLFMIPLRRPHIVEEDATLPYPEGRACAKVLSAGEAGGRKALMLLEAFTIGAIVKFLQTVNFKKFGNLGLFKDEVEFLLPKTKYALIGADLYPALLGVGIIVGPRIAAIVLAGGLLGWLVINPLIGHFVDGNLTAWDIWEKYLRYIGAGVVTAGGVFSIIESTPMMLRSIYTTFIRYKSNSRTQVPEERTDKDLPPTVILLGLTFVGLSLLAFLPITDLKAKIVTIISIIVFSFFFVVVSSQIVGLIGSSNQPVSGMTITALLATALVMKSLGIIGQEAMIATLVSAAVVCVALGAAGDMSQDLKTGFLVKATPMWQQVGEFIGVTVGSLILGIVIYVLYTTYGDFGTKELPAPQAMLMMSLTEGIFSGSAPWNMILIGIALGIVVRLLGVSVLAFGIGVYLPVHLSTPIFLGGLIHWLLVRSDIEEDATLLASGLIAGDALIGLLMAFVAFFGWIAPKIGNYLMPEWTSYTLFGLVVIYVMIRLSVLRKQISGDENLQGGRQ